MCAARYHGAGKPLSLESVAVRPPAYGETLVRVKAAGICHTDLHFLSGVLNLGISPLTLGHEIAGEVAELGEGERRRERRRSGPGLLLRHLRALSLVPG